MAAAEHVPLAEVKNRLSEMVDRLEDLESLEGTLAILSDPELMAAIGEADAEVATGGTT